jgi:hypothetical protein
LKAWFFLLFIYTGTANKSKLEFHKKDAGIGAEGDES